LIRRSDKAVSDNN